MAFPTSVNDQITDAVTQSNMQALGGASAQAAALVYQATAQALALAAEEATAQQQNAQTLAQAATARSVALLLGSAA
ncbi:MAG: glycerol-3-phosphate dehydrogenase [Comamonadaceae bacterium]|nr:MAG: glycerol-3-phosphate dehydrogenase [Comamonadaceae bacterium]